MSEVENKWPEGFTVTPTQRDLCMLLLEGKKRQEIAFKLEIQPDSISSLTAGLYRAVGVPGKKELVEVLKERGVPDARSRATTSQSVAPASPASTSTSVKKSFLTLWVVYVVDSKVEVEKSIPIRILMDIDSIHGSPLPPRWRTVANKNMKRNKAIFDAEFVESGRQLIEDLQALARLHGDDLKVVKCYVHADAFKIISQVMW